MTLENEITEFRRRMDKYISYICSRDFHKETRFTNSFFFFKKLYQNSLKKYLQLKLISSKKNIGLDFILSLINFFAFILILLVIYYLIKHNLVSISEIGATFVTITILYDKMRELFSSQLKGISELLPGLKNLHIILEENICHGDRELINNKLEIELKDVSFTYPNEERQALTLINLKIFSGDTIAIIGENGSGKTTLSKIISGLYPPSNGEVFFNAISLNEISLKSLYRRIAIVFQKYNKYPLSVVDNITISDTNKVLNRMEIDRITKFVELEKKLMI